MAEAWKTIRVFISSTFRDMHAERDHLVRFVFPRLREELLKRRMHIVDVDLRWGVIEEQDAFDLCMDEIDRCRPRFICILGQRYGWVPPPKVVRADAMGRVLASELSPEERSVLSEVYELEGEAYRQRKKPHGAEEVERWRQSGERAVKILQRAGVPEVRLSITAAEIFYAALNRLNKPAYPYFYFRDEDATRSIPVEHAPMYREPAGSFAEETLADLKKTIRKVKGKTPVGRGVSAIVKLPVFVYPCEWDAETSRLTRLEKFGEQVYRDLMESVDAEFGREAPQTLNEFDEEFAAMESFIERRIERYVVGNRREIFTALRSHTEGQGGNGYVCIVGEPGSGKSALLGKFYKDYVGGDKAYAEQRDEIVIPHFVGASSASTDVRQVLRRLCHALAVGAGFTEEIPHEYDKLREAFPTFLQMAAQVKHIVILIDAINQMDQAHNAHIMRWLPDELPNNARVILSVSHVPGYAAPTLEALRARRRSPAEVELRRLDEADAAAIVAEFLTHYGKTLDSEQRAALLSKRGAGLPLYLLTALEELRTLGTYDEITDRIRALPEETRPLFQWILKRLEQDDGFRDEWGERVGENLVKNYCSYLASGRAGMAQSELGELVAPADEERGLPADPLGNVAAVQRLLRPYLMQRGELLDFFHSQLREAVEETYLIAEETRRNVHREVVNYFRHKADPANDKSWTGNYARALSELPYHQTEAQMWDEVYETLTDLGFIEAKCTRVAVTTTGKDGDTHKGYSGVYELEEDYRRVLEHLPS
jgi:hypothetical protein